VTADPTPVRLGRFAGVALLLSSLLALAFFVAVVVEDRSAATTLLLVFALVTVPTLFCALLGLGAGVGLLRRGAAERSAAGCAAVLAVGHLGVTALSLRPGLDRELDDGDLLGGAAGAVGLMAALFALAVLLPARTLAVRLVAALAAGVLALALLSVRVLSLVG
jgi:hypothetical protein